MNLKKRGSTNNVGAPKDESSTIEKQGLINNIQNKNKMKSERSNIEDHSMRELLQGHEPVAQYTETMPLPEMFPQKAAGMGSEQKGRKQKQTERKKKIATWTRSTMWA